MSDQNQPPRGYELRDIQSRPAVIFSILLLAVIGFAILMAGLFHSRLESRFQERDVLPSPLSSADQTPPQPRLQVNPRLELDEALARDRQRLEGYRWIDQPAGVVQIPIERAMQLIVERGLPPISSPAAVPPNPENR